MRASPILIFHVTEQQATEVALAEYNNVVKAFPSDRTDQPFSISILPRGARRRWSIADAHRSESADKDPTIGAVPAFARFSVQFDFRLFRQHRRKADVLSVRPRLVFGRPSHAETAFRCYGEPVQRFIIIGEQE
jgi:hypothetical protein